MSHKFNAILAASNHDFDLESGAGLKNLLGDAVEESISIGTRSDEWIHRHQRGRFVRMVGLVTAAENAAKAFTAITGVHLPWNLNKTFKGWVNHDSIESANYKVEDWKRWTGFLGTVAGYPKEYPLLVAFIKATQSDRGTGSPYTTCSLRALVEKFSFSPGKIERTLRATEWQCNRFLRGYNIQFSHKHNWNSMADVLAPRCTRPDTEDGWGPQCFSREDRSGFNPAKAGKKLAALIINERLKRISGQRFSGKSLEVLMKARGFRSILPMLKHGKKDVTEWVYPNSRQVVRWAVDRINAGEFAHLREAIHSSDRLVCDNTDGVELLTDPVGTVEIHGFRVTSGYRLVAWGRGRRQCVDVTHLVVGPTGRSYHADHGLAPMKPNATWRGYEATPRGYIREALEAWQKQDDSAKLAVSQFPNLSRTDCTILVTREDSYRAGNCSAGTEAWINRTGVGTKRWCVPANVLLGYADDPQVARVLAVANRDAARLSA